MLTLNSVFKAEGIDIGAVQLIRHKDQRVKESEGKSLFDVWFSDRTRFDSYQSVQRKKYAFNDGGLLASFVVTNTNETLFVGIYNVVNRRPAKQKDFIAWPHLPPGSDDVFHTLKLSEKMSEYVRRLVIEPWPDAINYVKKATACDPKIREIKRLPEEDAFPGYLKFSRHGSNLNSIFPSWQKRLSDAKGVYLLSFPDGQYVGSASGASGFWQRWQNYNSNGHGGNRTLKRDRRDVRVNATISILEVAGSALSRNEIVALEMIWQKKLGPEAKSLDQNDD